MFNNSSFSRPEYIKNCNELNKKSNLDSYKEGNVQRQKMGQKLDELSLRSGSMLSGNIVRQNVISSTSGMTNVNSFSNLSGYTEHEKVNNNSNISTNKNPESDMLKNMNALNNSCRFNNLK